MLTRKLRHWKRSLRLLRSLRYVKWEPRLNGVDGYRFQTVVLWYILSHM